MRIEQRELKSASKPMYVDVCRIDHRSAPLGMLPLIPVAALRMHAAADARGRLVDGRFDSRIAQTHRGYQSGDPGSDDYDALSSTRLGAAARNEFRNGRGPKRCHPESADKFVAPQSLMLMSAKKPKGCRTDEIPTSVTLKNVP